MPVLVCTVRGCLLPLEERGRGLRCPRGHSFDRAREGYWNLLQPQHRRSARAGDAPAAAAARGRWLERGFADGLVEALRGFARPEALPPRAVVLDLGCGDGWFAARLLAGRAADLCGVDLSVAAIRRAARRLPAATWVVANADRCIPVPDRSVDLALSIFGRRPAAELARVVRPGGRLVAVIPAAEDLQELRQAAQGRAVRRDRAPAVQEDLGPAFRLARRGCWRRRALHDRAALEDALAMTYRGARRSERQRLRDVGSLEVTLAADLLEFELAAAGSRRRRSGAAMGAAPGTGPGTA